MFDLEFTAGIRADELTYRTDKYEQVAIVSRLMPDREYSGKLSFDKPQELFSSEINTFSRCKVVTTSASWEVKFNREWGNVAVPKAASIYCHCKWLQSTVNTSP